MTGAGVRLFPSRQLRSLPASTPDVPAAAVAAHRVQRVGCPARLLRCGERVLRLVVVSGQRHQMHVPPAVGQPADPYQILGQLAVTGLRQVSGGLAHPAPLLAVTPIHPDTLSHTRSITSVSPGAASDLISGRETRRGPTRRTLMPRSAGDHALTANAEDERAVPAPLWQQPKLLESLRALPDMRVWLYRTSWLGRRTFLAPPARDPGKRSSSTSNEPTVRR